MLRIFAGPTTPPLGVKVSDINRPVLKAFLLAPLAPGIAWAVLMLNPVVLLFAVPLGYLGMLFFGLPLFFLVRRFWRVSLVSSVCSGAISGSFASLIFSWWGGSFEISTWFFKGAILFVIFGAIAGSTFWWLYRAQQGAPGDAPKASRP